MGKLDKLKEEKSDLREIFKMAKNARYKEMESVD